MKINALIRTLLLGAVLSTGSLFANTVVLDNTDNDGNINGGEFLATLSNGRTFYTFCIEAGISVSLGTTYNYTIDSSAYSGGGDIHSPGVGDPISKGTAWLYEKFYFGTLIDTDGVGTYFDAGIHSGLAARDYNAGVLQKAFWDLEDEGADVGNYYVNLAVTHFAGLGQDAYSDVGPGSKVAAMNLWTLTTGADVQSQLIYVPDSGMTVALLGLGLLSLAAFRRKL